MTRIAAYMGLAVFAVFVAAAVGLSIFTVAMLAWHTFRTVVLETDLLTWRNLNHFGEGAIGAIGLMIGLVLGGTFLFLFPKEVAKGAFGRSNRSSRRMEILYCFVYASIAAAIGL